jgi:hypothetical protein
VTKRNPEHSWKGLRGHLSLEIILKTLQTNINPSLDDFREKGDIFHGLSPPPVPFFRILSIQCVLEHSCALELLWGLLKTQTAAPLLHF